jgi:bacterioferritin
MAPAPGQQEVTMERETLIAGLNHDLAGEYQAILQYLQHYFILRGTNRLTLGEFFKKSSMDEMKHADFLAEKVVALGGTPTVEIRPISQPQDSEAMLRANLDAERQAIRDYTERVRQAEEYGDLGLANDLEEILSDETHHAEELEKLIGG